MDEIYWCRMWDTAWDTEGRAPYLQSRWKLLWFAGSYVAFQFSKFWISFHNLVAEHQGQSLKIQNVAIVFRVFFCVTATKSTQSEHGSADIKEKKPAGFPIFVLTPDLSLSAWGHRQHDPDPHPRLTDHSCGADRREWWSISTWPTSMTNLLSDGLSSQWINRGQDLILEGGFVFKKPLNPKTKETASVCRYI